MKNITKMARIGLILLVFLLYSCSKEEPINNIEGDWTVISFEDRESSRSIKKTEENTWMDYNNGNITVNFSLSGNSTGVISGTNVTNTFSGNVIVGPGRKLDIHDIIWTEVNEPEWGRMFHSISLAESFELDGNLLTIFYNNKRNSIILEKFRSNKPAYH